MRVHLCFRDRYLVVGYESGGRIDSPEELCCAHTERRRESNPKRGVVERA